MSNIVYNFFLFVAIKLKFGAMIASIWINFQAKLIYRKASGNPQIAQDFYIPHTWYQRNGVKSLPEFATKVWLSPSWIPNSPMWITNPSLWKVSLHSATLHSYSFNYQQEQRYCYSSQLANVHRMIDKLLCIKLLVSLTYQNKHSIFTIRTYLDKWLPSVIEIQHSTLFQDLCYFQYEEHYRRSGKFHC